MTEDSRIIHLNITFRNTESTDALRTYANDKVTHALKKFVHKNTEAHLVLKVEKNRQIAEISLSADGGTFSCKEETNSLYSSIDALVDSLSQQLRKHKEKLTSHHA